ncbi:glycerol-3-phosphate dehydrogenase [Rhodobaculum claviforme]|uniref:glycerol-3-phosphate dehydrogenase n=1 Tax=Rhodobaculum claviforme TaxID=1549854 RepID=UPI003083F1C6
MERSPEHDCVDLFVIGGGINGTGIARDAAGRGLSVTLAEMGDLGGATSSASTKLFHGGLRYLEYFEVRLVRESLAEREVLLRAMPHIAWPMRFVLPWHPDMRFESTTPAARLLGRVMPWLRGRRPAWMIRLGLFMYDTLGGRTILPGTTTLRLRGTAEGAPLQDAFETAFEYSDCWVEDSRLVVLNARDAEARGADIRVRTRVTAATRHDGLWTIHTEDTETGARHTHRARILVNAGGPWVAEILRGRLRINGPDGVRLVRGSHIVTRRLFDHNKCYFLQGADGRIIFAIPYEGDFTLIGTTDVEHADPDQPPECTQAERDYLLAFANRYFRRQLTADDIVHTYSGVRPLHDDGASSATAATRDYTITRDTTGGAPLLSVFGGKITTYRRLAESVMDEVARLRPGLPGRWTAGVPLPGGDFAVDGVGALIDRLRADHPFLTQAWAMRLVRAYGTDAWAVLAGARDAADLGHDFGATLTEREVAWLMRHEYARTADDVLWRRGKLGLRLDARAARGLGDWMADRRRGDARTAAE